MPPIVQEIDGELEVIDGQHTAIAACTRGGIGKIPVMVTVADDIAGRATAFVRHNKNRIQVTPLQLHKAMVASGGGAVGVIWSASAPVCGSSKTRRRKTSLPSATPWPSRRSASWSTGGMR